MSLSKLKLDSQNLKRNLEYLQQVAAGNLTLESKELSILKQKTKKLQKRLSKKNITKLIKQRQKKHKLKKIKRKQEMIYSTIINKTNEYKRTNKESIEKQHESNRNQASATIRDEPNETITQRNQRLQRYKTAQNYLKTFDLLKRLHYARGRNSDETLQFARNLQSLRLKWQHILNENETKCNKEYTLEDEWNEVFFGVSDSGGNTEEGTKEQKLNNFIQKRRIWDSYLTRNSNYGSSIPNGWVLPKADNNDIRWLQYQTN